MPKNRNDRYMTRSSAGPVYVRDPNVVITYHIEADTTWLPFADDIFISILLNGNIWILIEISLKFVPSAPIINIQTLVQIMAWRRSGDKPLFEPMMVSICASLGPNELTIIVLIHRIITIAKRDTINPFTDFMQYSVDSIIMSFQSIYEKRQQFFSNTNVILRVID